MDRCPELLVATLPREIQWPQHQRLWLLVLPVDPLPYQTAPGIIPSIFVVPHFQRLQRLTSFMAI